MSLAPALAGMRQRGGPAASAGEMVVRGRRGVVEVAELVRAAATGDQEAWNLLVERFSGLLWATVRAHRLNAADGAEVIQTTWLRLVEHLDRIRDPERVGAWLATTARHESLQSIRRGAREVATDDVSVFDGRATHGEELDRGLLARERDVALWSAFANLGDRCKSLLRILMADAPPSYEEVAAALGMPIGSIGPTRQRCLDRLRQDPQLGAAGVTP
jgi:RNA polymerase sigma factor (sigma-70 family)